MSTYVLSDIHGEYDAFMEILENIHFTDQDILYVMGDVIDRGPHPIRVLQEMMQHPNIIPLIGNHEYMGLSCLRFLMKEITEESLPKLDMSIYEKLLNWEYNGCTTTLDEFRKLDLVGRQEIIDYIEEFILYEELTVRNQDYILVHAGLGNFEPNRPLWDYDIHELVWERPDYNRQYFDDRIVITGHTPTMLIPENDKPGYIFRKNNHIAIDCGACFSGGRLGAICLDTDEEFYSATNQRT